MIDAIIRPPRYTYNIRELGATISIVYSTEVIRTDLELKNSRGLTLQCSHYEPTPRFRAADKIPCVIYLHGNSSCRIEGKQAVYHLLPLGASVFCFDFAGSGNSEGDYVTLGWNERHDVKAVVKYLREQNRTTYIGLWGRSMGAATALMYGGSNPDIAGMVLDSPFSSFATLAQELAAAFGIPSFLSGVVLSFVGNTIRSTLEGHVLARDEDGDEFDLMKLSPVSHAPNCFTPVLFIAANDDLLINKSHSQTLYDAYGVEPGEDKRVLFVEGDHNSVRDHSVMNEIEVFFRRALRLDELAVMDSSDLEGEGTRIKRRRRRGEEHRQCDCVDAPVVEGVYLDRVELAASGDSSILKEEEEESTIQAVVDSIKQARINESVLIKSEEEVAYSFLLQGENNKK